MHNDKEEIKQSINPNRMMQLSFEPGRVFQGEEVALALIPGHMNKAFDLEVQHEKKIHLIIVSDDLSWFSHIHPEPDSTGNYKVKTVFPFAGRFHAYADYKPVGGDAVVERFEFDVEGNERAPENFNTQKLIGISGNYSLELKPGEGELKVGEGNHLAGVIKKDGNPIDVNELNDYLGAKAHVVVIGQENKTFVHAHPHEMGKQLGMHIAFDKPGIFRGWVQFNVEGRLHTIDLTFKVGEGREEEISMNLHGSHH